MYYQLHIANHQAELAKREAAAERRATRPIDEPRPDADDSVKQVCM